MLPQGPIPATQGDAMEPWRTLPEFLFGTEVLAEPSTNRHCGAIGDEVELQFLLVRRTMVICALSNKRTPLRRGADHDRQKSGATGLHRLSSIGRWQTIARTFASDKEGH